MSATVNTNAFRDFIVSHWGSKITQEKANNLGISQDKFDAANTNDNEFLEINEILVDQDLYEQFATMFNEEKEKKAEKKDAQQEKKELTSVNQKGGAGAA